MDGTEFAQIDDIAVGDEVLPNQWAELHKRNTSSPEKRLLLAALQDSIRIIQKNKREWRVKCELDWISDTSHEGIFSFESVCEHLGIDASWLRGKILRGEMRLMPQHFLNERPALKITATRDSHEKYSALG